MIFELHQPPVSEAGSDSFATTNNVEETQMCWALQVRDTELARFDQDKAILVLKVVKLQYAVMG